MDGLEGVLLRGVDAVLVGIRQVLVQEVVQGFGRDGLEQAREAAAGRDGTLSNNDDSIVLLVRASLAVGTGVLAAGAGVADGANGERAETEDGDAAGKDKGEGHGEVGDLLGLGDTASAGVLALALLVVGGDGRSRRLGGVSEQPLLVLCCGIGSHCDV